MQRPFFPLAFLLSALLLGCADKKTPAQDTRPLVRIGSVSNGVEFVDALNVQGMIRAKNVAAVAARVPGTLDEMLAEEGMRVRRGQPLFKIDQVNLANAVRAAKDDLAMAKAKLAQAAATVAKAKLDVERMTRLEKDGAVTRDMFEKADVAARSYAAALDAAKATVTKAETGLAVATKNFADSEAKAPFDGIITRKFRNVGDFCSPGVKVFDIEDASRHEICLSLNAARYGSVVVGKTEIDVGEKGGRTLAVSYKAPSVDPMTRTFEVRAAIEKTPALATGMLVDCRIVFDRHRSQAVPAAAVATRGGGDCVFKVVGGKVVRIPVVAGHAANGLREILSPVIPPDDRLIVEGMLLVNENDDVRTADR